MRPRSTPLAYRSLIWNFARRDLKARYRGTLLGWVWSLVLPLATLLIFSLVFSVVFRFEPPPFGNGESGNFTVWLLAGLVVWNFFLGSVSVSMPSLIATGPLLQKVYLPAYTAVFGTVIAIFIQSLVELGLLVVILILFGNVGTSWMLLPVWLVLLLIFTASCAVVCSVLNVYFRDLAQVVAVTLQLLFYLTPIIYSADLVPTEWRGLPLRAVIERLPLSGFVQSFRDLTYGLTSPSPMTWGIMILWAGSSLALALIVYRSRGHDVGEFA